MHVVPNPSVICGVTPSLKLKRSNGLRPLLLADYGAYGSWRASRIDPAARRSVPQRQLDRNGFSFHWAGDGGSVGPFSCSNEGQGSRQIGRAARREREKI